MLDHCMKKPGDYHGPYWYLFTKRMEKLNPNMWAKTYL